MALFCAAGAAALAAGGPLSFPGLAGALLLCALPSREARSVLGSLAAGVSFAGQALHYGGICPACFLGACLLAGGAFASAVASSRQVLCSIFLLVPVLSLGLLASRVQVPPAVVAKARAPVEVLAPAPGGPEPGVLVYFSPWCGHCRPVLEAFASADPRGALWRPVAVPNVALEAGKEELSSFGYRGEVLSSGRVPGGALPAASFRGRLYRGEGECLRLARELFGKGGARPEG